MAVANYAEAHGHYPPAFVRGPDGRPWHSWRILLLPYIEKSDLFREYDFNEPWDGPNNRKLADRMPNVYRFHPERNSKTEVTNYLAVVGPETVWPGSDTITRKEVTDPLETTILIVENRGAGIHWMEPRDLEFDRMNFKLGTADGISSWYRDPAAAMTDTSVNRLTGDLTPETLRALLTRSGGEKLTSSKGDWEWLRDGRDREPADPKP